MDDLFPNFVALVIKVVNDGVQEIKVVIVDYFKALAAVAAQLVRYPLELLLDLLWGNGVDVAPI